MSRVFHISDLHLGHKLMVKPELTMHRCGSDDIEHHDEWIVEQWNKVVKKQDLVWVHGDVCFDKKKLPLLKKMYGSKHLILGNHDEFPLKDYEMYFNKIHGFWKYKGSWLSHAPVHPNQLRNKWNIHGHVHTATIPDLRYFNVSVEALKGIPISRETIELMMIERRIFLKAEEEQK